MAKCEYKICLNPNCSRGLKTIHIYPDMPIHLHEVLRHLYLLLKPLYSIMLWKKDFMWIFLTELDKAPGINPWKLYSALVSCTRKAAEVVLDYKLNLQTCTKHSLAPSWFAQALGTQSMQRVWPAPHRTQDPAQGHSDKQMNQGHETEGKAGCEPRLQTNPSSRDERSRRYHG